MNVCLRLGGIPFLLLFYSLLMLAGCTTQQEGDRAQSTAPTAAPAAAAPPVPPTQPFQTAVESAATALLNTAEKNPGVAADTPRALMIDPLVDGNNAQRTASSEAMGTQIGSVVKTKAKRLKLASFSLPTLQRKPLLLVGTLTPINAAGDASAKPDVYRICLSLIDTQTGKVIAKGTARASMNTVDASPTPYFRDSPTSVKDKITDGYIGSCQRSKPGDDADKIYLQTLATSIAVNNAILAYDDGKVSQARTNYRSAATMPGGDQKRVINGLYLTSWKLKRQNEAADAFGKIVERGIQDQKLGVKFLFQPNSDSFVANSDLRAQYDLWLKVIAKQAAATQSCLLIVGHSGKSISETSNEQTLSERRADAIRIRLVRLNPALKEKLMTEGRGSRETIVGTGTNDLRDAPDRRVEFSVQPTCA